jgi:3-hydroxybutyryl-CoA dehydrogenase
MNVDDIRRILVVGAGTMGQQIALQCASHGYQAIVYDISPAALENASERIKVYATQLVDARRLTAEASQAALDRLAFSTDPQVGAGADLLSESVPEDPELKAKVFAQFNTICPPHTIFTTDTSTLVPSTFAAATGRPAQFAAFHFYQYVWESNLVDVMPHPGTSPETVQLLAAFARRIGQVPLVFKKESPEYVVNAILGAINSTAINLVFRDEVASVEDVDRAVMIALKMPVGPFGGLDVVGLDTIWHITQTRARATGDPEAQRFADRFKRDYVEKGWLGVKSGRGFYTYPDPAYARPGFLSGESSPAEGQPPASG